MRWTLPAWIGVGVLAGCASDQAMSPPDAAAPRLETAIAENPSGPDGSKVFGAGQFEHPTFGRNEFSFVGFRLRNGRVEGEFEYRYLFATAADGTPVKYGGRVTCFAYDRVNHRAWIGGVLTYSNDPDPNPIFTKGHDAWFRVLDTGNGTDPDRITFVGFEGGGGIATSVEYCARKIWPGPNDTPPQPLNARTWPVVSGKIVVY